MTTLLIGKILINFRINHCLNSRLARMVGASPFLVRFSNLIGRCLKRLLLTLRELACRALKVLIEVLPFFCRWINSMFRWWHSLETTEQPSKVDPRVKSYDDFLTFSSRGIDQELEVMDFQLPVVTDLGSSWLDELLDSGGFHRHQRFVGAFDSDW